MRPRELGGRLLWRFFRSVVRTQPPQECVQSTRAQAAKLRAEKFLWINSHGFKQINTHTPYVNAPPKLQRAGRSVLRVKQREEMRNRRFKVVMS